MKRIVVALIGLLLVAYLLTSLTSVRPGERAVVRRFGKVLPEKPEPGLFVGLPWGMDRVDRVPVDFVRRVEVGYRPESGEDVQAPPGQLLTGDHNLINIQIVLHYSVIEEEVEDYVVQADRADGMVARVAESALAEWVAARTVDDVIVNAKATLPSWIVRRTRERIKPYRLGIQIRDEASIAYLFPPEEVRVAFDNVTKEQTTMRTRRYQAEQAGQQAIREAEVARFQAQQRGAAYVREQRLFAEADAASFERRREQYHRLRAGNPNILAGIWWEAMATVFTRLRDNGHVDLLDHHLGSDGLDIMQIPPSPKKK